MDRNSRVFFSAERRKNRQSNFMDLIYGVNGCIAYLWAIGMIVTVTLSGPMI